MGITYIDGAVKGPSGKTATVRFLVDSGVTYSLVPKDTWQAIELEHKRSASFALIDGTQVERKISECHLTFPQGRDILL